jgi:hypothetical protein
MEWCVRSVELNSEGRNPFEQVRIERPLSATLLRNLATPMSTSAI